MQCQRVELGWPPYVRRPREQFIFIGDKKMLIRGIEFYHEDIEKIRNLIAAGSGKETELFITIFDEMVRAVLERERESVLEEVCGSFKTMIDQGVMELTDDLMSFICSASGELTEGISYVLQVLLDQFGPEMKILVNNLRLKIALSPPT